MHKYILNRKGLALCLSILSLTLFSTAGHATYGNWRVQSDAGNYAPVAHGSDLQLNACNSQLYNISSSQSYSVCDLPSVDQFRLYWYRYEASLGVSLMGIFNNGGVGGNPPASEGLTPTFATGTGTYFPIQSTYYVGLYLIAEANAVIDLPDGGQASVGSYTLSSFDWSNAFSVVAPVSEPLAALLLLPALLSIGAIQRRRRRTR